MADAGRLVELFKEACSLAGSVQEAFVRRISDEDATLGNSLADLLSHRGPVPMETGSFARKLKAQYGMEVDPNISLEGESEGSDFASEIVRRLAGRGETYGRYRLKGEVARGGQGAIMRVWDEDLRRNLAMKVVLGKGEPTGQTPRVDSKTLGRFLEEAQVTGQLDHPGIVPVHELGLDDQGQVYFTMKLVKGRDMRAVFGLVREGKEGWTQTRALSVLLKVCEAMAYAHSKGVIHRDLKPSNVMVGKFGEVFVMDWGLARVLGRKDEKDIRIVPQATTVELRSERHDKLADSPDSPLVTMDGDVVGTPAYMSPEQAAGDLDGIGPQSDVYAVGAMLYHLLAGHMPYVPPGVRLSNYAVWALVQTGAPEPIDEAARDVPSELIAICDKAMERKASSRYADMLSLADDLRAFLEERVVHAYETGAWAETRKWVRRNRPLAASLVGAFALLVAGLVTALVLRQRALDNAELAKKRMDDVFSLAAFQRLDGLTKRASKLWPPHPDLVRPYDRWLLDAEELIATLDPDPGTGDSGHRARLDALRDTKPLSQSFRDLIDEDLWWRGQLEKLIAQIEAFSDPELGLVRGISPEHGWGVLRRREWALKVEDLTLSSSAASELWAEAISWISDPEAFPAYGGMQIQPQLGLVPLGEDPVSGLWEFAYPLTGDIPERDDDGKLVLTEETGLVFVLLPGGTFVMGAQKRHLNGANYDPQAMENEDPIREVTLSPFFLSKYEMTQGQWLRFTENNPSRDDPEVYQPSWNRAGLPGNLLHPIEQVDWFESVRTLEWMGLVLPTEAQWEYGARGGTTSAWSTGDEKESLAGRANLSDRFARNNGGEAWGKHENWLDDGNTSHARVGSYAANPFGLHDVHGNVWEWCSDVDGDGTPPGSIRGGSFGEGAATARSAARNSTPPENPLNYLGLRPARAITGEIRCVGEGK